MATSIFEKLLDEHERAKKPAQPTGGMGYGLDMSDLGAAGVLPRAARPAAVPDVPEIPDAVPDVPDAVSGVPELPGAGSETIAPQGAPAAEMVAQGVPRMFPSSAGPAGAYNMGELAPPGSVEVDANGVPLGTQMVPVAGISRGRARVGVPDIMGPQRPMALPPDTAEMSRRNPQGVPDLGGAAVLRADDAERETLRSMRAGTFDQGSRTTRDVSAQDRLEEFNRAQRGANAAAQRQIDVARRTPQISVGAGGIGGWDPNANDGKGGMVTVARPVVERGAAGAARDLEGATDLQLMAQHAKLTPRPADKNNLLYIMAMQKATTPEEKASVEQEFSHSGDPEMLAAVEQELRRRGLMQPAGEGGQPAAGKGQAAGAKEQPAAGGQPRKYKPNW